MLNEEERPADDGIASGYDPDPSRSAALRAETYTQDRWFRTDIANLVNWLASDEVRYATGQLWVLDGGISAQVQQMKL